MILKFGWREFKSEFYKYVPMMLQMALIMFITIACVTSVQSRFQYLNAFQDLWEKDGYVFFAQNLHFDQQIGMQEPLMRASLHGVQDIELSSRYIGLQLNIDSPLIYSDRLMERMQPEMSEGAWIVSVPKDSLPNVMVNENSGYHIGDVIAIRAEDTSPQADTNMQLRVAGVYPENAKLLLMNGGAIDAGITDYRQILAEIDTVQNTTVESVPLSVIMSESEASKIFTADQYAPSGICMITFEHGLSDDEQYENEQMLRNAINGPYIMWQNSDLYAESKLYCFKQAYALLPILIGVLALFSISMVSVNSVSAIRKQRTYMIYRICGLKWQRCVWISAVKAGITSLGAVFICCLLMFLKQMTGIFENLLIEFGVLQWLFCIGFAMLDMVVALCIGSAIQHSTQIRQILKES